MYDSSVYIVGIVSYCKYLDCGIKKTFYDNFNFRDGSPEKLWIDSLRRNDKKYPPTPRHIHQINPQAPVLAKLKKAALYQPPPVAPLDSPGTHKHKVTTISLTPPLFFSSLRENIFVNKLFEFKGLFFQRNCFFPQISQFGQQF